MVGMQRGEWRQGVMVGTVCSDGYAVKFITRAKGDSTHQAYQ